MSVNREYTTYLALGNGVEEKVVQLLTPLLADTIFLQNLYKHYQWHVEGDDHYQYSPLFQKHAAEQLPIIDLLARRIRILGANAPAMPADVVSRKTLEEPSDPGHDDESMIRNMCILHEKCIKNLRATIDKVHKLGDAGTTDMLVRDVLHLHELQVLTVRSSLDL